jgi:transposase
MSEQISLFPNLEVPVGIKSPTTHAAKPRLRSAERNQIEFKIGSLNELISLDHKARYVVDFVEQLDLSKILSGIRSVDYGVGRPATDPKILLALWLFAVLEGIISARTIADFCAEHIAYQWICGGVSINHHTLSDFATKHGEQFDDFLTQSVAILTKHGFVDLDSEDVAQDGMRVRASAGSSSFRREKTLQELHKDAKEYIIRLKAEHEKNPSACRTRQSTAALRAAVEREQKIAESLKNMDLFLEEKEENLKKHRKKLSEKKSKNCVCQQRILNQE